LKRSNEIIEQFGGALVKDLKAAIPKATGATADSVRVEYKIKDGKITGFNIWGFESIGALIDGRNPTKNGAKKGNPTLQQSLLTWIRAKGITPRESSMTDVSLSWAISKSIHKNGFPANQKVKDVFSSIRLKSFSNSLAEAESVTIQSSIIKEFKFV